MPIQLIDSRKLSAEENLWLAELDNRLTALQIRRLAEEIWRLGNAAHIAAYIDAVMQANQKSVEEMYKMSDSALTLDEVFERVGATARWEAKGEAKGKEAIVRNMLKSGFPVEQIASLSGLDIETIKAMNI